MSTIAMRTPAKVQSLRTVEFDANDKGAGPQSHLARAVTLHLAGKREEALRQLQRAIAANEASAEIDRAMGHIHFELGTFDEAAKAYRTLVQMKPQYAMGWFNLGVCLERGTSGKMPPRSSTNPAPGGEAPGCVPRVGGLPPAEEDPKSALFSFERCLERTPTHVDALFGKAVALQSLGHLDQAVGIYQHPPEAIRTARNRSPTWC